MPRLESRRSSQSPWSPTRERSNPEVARIGARQHPPTVRHVSVVLFWIPRRRRLPPTQHAAVHVRAYARTASVVTRLASLVVVWENLVTKHDTCCLEMTCVVMSMARTCSASNGAERNSSKSIRHRCTSEAPTHQNRRQCALYERYIGTVVSTVLEAHSSSLRCRTLRRQQRSGA